MSDLNDPRVLFAAERTLLAWSRTSAGLMAFGFLIDRAGVMVHGAGSYGTVSWVRHTTCPMPSAASNDQSARPGYDMPASATGVRLTQ